MSPEERAQGILDVLETRNKAQLERRKARVIAAHVASESQASRESEPPPATASKKGRGKKGKDKAPPIVDALVADEVEVLRRG